MTLELARAPVIDGFRQRGVGMTRAETFTDAAFAFALTLLVISFDELPTSLDELLAALRKIPAFAASFAQISMFWYAHHKWSRRYGLDDLPAVLLSLSLVFVTLIFVFPLRIVFSGFFAWISGGRLPYELGQMHPAEVGTIFVIYGAGFVAMSAIIVLAYAHALRRRSALGLDPGEEFTTRAEVQAWLILLAVGATSTVYALTAPAYWKPLAGMIYATLAIVMPWFGVAKARQYRRLTAATGEEPDDPPVEQNPADMDNRRPWH